LVAIYESLIINMDEMISSGLLRLIQGIFFSSGKEFLVRSGESGRTFPGVDF
jgi:hypothetical protein